MAEQSEKKAPEKAKQPEKKKVGFLKKASRFFKDLKSELKKVVWPTKKQVFNNTVVVFTVMAGVGVFTWVVDALLSFLRGLLL